MRQAVGNASAGPGWNWRRTADPMVMNAYSEAEAEWGGEASDPGRKPQSNAQVLSLRTGLGSRYD